MYKRQISTVKGNDMMKKLITVEGMSCPHCQAHVKKALEEVEGVQPVSYTHLDVYKRQPSPHFVKYPIYASLALPVPATSILCA